MSYNLTIDDCEQRLQLTYRPGGDFPPFLTDTGRPVQADRVTVNLQRGPWPQWRPMLVSVMGSDGVGQHLDMDRLAAVTEDTEPRWLPVLLRQAINTARGTTLLVRQPETPAATVPA